jgi:hypothetical protein
MVERASMMARKAFANGVLPDGIDAPPVLLGHLGGRQQWST